MDEEPTNPRQGRAQHVVEEESYLDICHSQDDSQQVSLLGTLFNENPPGYYDATLNQHTSIPFNPTARDLGDIAQYLGDAAQATASLYGPGSYAPFNPVPLPPPSILGYNHTITPSMDVMVPFPFRPGTAAESTPEVFPRVSDPAPVTKENETTSSSGLEPWTQEMDTFLLENRKKGRPYSRIAKDMYTKYPKMGKITQNRLVKRMRKLQEKEKNLDKLPQVVKRALPKILAAIQEEIDIEFSDGSKMEKDMHDDILRRLPKKLPAYIQDEVTRWRKAQGNTSLEDELDE